MTYITIYKLFNYERLSHNKLTFFPKLNTLAKENSKSISTIKIANICLEHSSFIKYLGGYVDCHLTWHGHIDYISSGKINSSKKSEYLNKVKAQLNDLHI